MNIEAIIPGIQKLSDLFSSVVLVPKGGAAKHKFGKVSNPDVGEISGYCQVSGGAGIEDIRAAFDVVPSDMLLDAIKQSMLRVDNGIYFEIIVYDDGEAAVFGKYQTILGSRRLAYVKADEVRAIIEGGA